MARCTVPVRLLFVSLFCLTALACGSADEPEEGSLGQDAFGSTDQDSTEEGADVSFPDKCVGLKAEEKAEEYNDACEGIDTCTQMDPQPGPCWCGFCGPRGADIACLKVICATPGQ